MRINSVDLDGEDNGGGTIEQPAPNNFEPCFDLLDVDRRNLEPAPVNYDATLYDPGPQRILTITIVREATGLGLADAKALVDQAPQRIIEAVSRDVAATLVAQLREAGAEARFDESYDPNAEPLMGLPGYPTE